MNSSVWFDTVSLGWFIVPIKGSQVRISKYRGCYILANSADIDEMLYFVAFHLGLHCLPKYSLRGCTAYKGLIHLS